MGIGWAICPICGKRFEGSYFPDTGVNTAVCTVKRHAILRHKKKITDDGRIVDAKIPDDFIKVSETKTFVAGTTGNTRFKRNAYITCVCGRSFIIDFNEVRYDGGRKKIEVVVREYEDEFTQKIGERTETIEVGYIDVSKFEKLWEQTWENVKARIIREHLGEHGIHL